MSSQFLTSTLHEEQFKAERLKDITEDRTHGAAELARASLQVLADYCALCSANRVDELRDKLRGFALALQSARPSMMPLRNLLESWMECIRDQNVEEVDVMRGLASDFAYDIIRQSHNATSKIAEYVAAMIPEDSVVMTHSLSSTIVECFRQLGGKNVHAIITESRPGFEGRILAELLVENAVSAKFITDAQMGLFVAEADFILIGADSILADGSVVNKAGTYLLALAAEVVETPVYVCAETFKQSFTLAEAIELEEKSGEELGLAILPHITPVNIYFDITPAALISGWINEHGINTTF